MEIWKDIEGFEGLYKVSTFGNICSYPKKVTYKDGRVYNYKSKILKPCPNKSGYVHLNLFSSTGDSKTFDVHRIVAIAFLPRIEGKNEVNHKNGNKSDNSLKNLEWMTSDENKKHAWDTGLCTNEQMRKASFKRWKKDERPLL